MAIFAHEQENNDGLATICMFCQVPFKVEAFFSFTRQLTVFD